MAPIIRQSSCGVHVFKSAAPYYYSELTEAHDLVSGAPCYPSEFVRAHNLESGALLSIKVHVGPVI